MTVSLDQDFSQLNSYISTLKPSQLLILVDENTHEFCLPTLLGNLETDISFEIIEISAGEEMKTIETASQLWEIFAEFGVDRKALLINLGGGVITDLGGFVASTYKRGIKFINIPTTLLGMCDASIGGKTGIDHQYLKNLVGTFAEPERIFVYADFLKTLKFEELRSGFAEMLKHGLIADQKHWKDLTAIEKLSADNIAPFIERSMQIKQNVVEEDFTEQNIRKTLNFGHTVGHALESLFLQTGKPVLHGEAVAAGMMCETYLSYREGFITEATALSVIESIRKFYPKLNIEHFTEEQILLPMYNDKKNTSNGISFTLITDIGKSKFDCFSTLENIISGLIFYKNLD